MDIPGCIESPTLAVSVADPTLPDTPIVFVNDAFGLVTHYRRGDVLGRNGRFLQGTGTRAETVSKIRSSIALRQPQVSCILNYRADGVAFNNLLITKHFRADTGQPLVLGCQFPFSPQTRLEDLGRHLDHCREVAPELGAAQAPSQFFLDRFKLAACIRIWTMMQAHLDTTAATPSHRPATKLRLAPEN